MILLLKKTQMIYTNDKCPSTPSKFKGYRINYRKVCRAKKTNSIRLIRKQAKKNCKAKLIIYNKNYRVCKQKFLNRKTHNSCHIIIAINIVRASKELCKTSISQKKLRLGFGQILLLRQTSASCYR